jgi:hypothetical protein
VGALSLGGWYLIVPPNLPDSSKADTSAPLWQWIRLGHHEYDTREQCESDLEDSRQHRQPSGARVNQEAQDASQCISTEDPRLKADQLPSD